jgi:hypothetical protein
MERMVDVESYWKHSKLALGRLRRKGWFTLTEESLWVILQYEYEVGMPEELFGMRLSTAQIECDVEMHMNRYGAIIGELEIPVSLHPDYLLEADDIEKGRVSVNNTIWIVHKSDSDPHPSNPHAHNYEGNCKIHLGNGTLYRKRNVCGHLSKRDLKEIRDRISKTLHIELPPLEL